MSMNSENRNAENIYAACTEFEASLEDHLQGSLRGSEAASLTEHLRVLRWVPNGSGRRYRGSALAGDRGTFARSRSWF